MQKGVIKMLHGLKGKNLIIAESKEEVNEIARKHFECKKGEKLELKMTSGRGERLKTYRVTIVKKVK